MAKLEVEILESVESLRAEAAPWDDLWLRSDVKLPVARAEAIALWLGHFAPGCSLRAVTVKSEGRLVAALPLYMLRGDRLRMWRLPGNEWSPAGELLIDPKCDVGQVLGAMVDALAALPGLLLRLDAVVIDAPRWVAFQAALRGRGLAHASAARFEIGRVKIGDDWTAYLAARSGNHRRHMRKALTRAKQRGPVELQICRTADHVELESLLRQAFNIEDRCWKGRQGSSVLRTPGRFEFFLQQAQLMSRWGQCELLFLKLAGEPIAFEYGWTSKQTYFSPKIGYDERYEDVTPGQLLRYCYYEHLHASGEISEIDYLGPLSSATGKWSTESYRVARILVAPDRVLSRLAIFGYCQVWRRVRALRMRKAGSSASEAPESPKHGNRKVNKHLPGLDVEDAEQVVSV